MQKYMYMYRKNFERGFTLIELIITVVVIGILAGALLALINPVEVTNRGRYSKAESDMNKFLGAVSIVQLNTGNTLGEITGSWNSGSSCSSGDLRNTTGACYSAWVSARNALTLTSPGQFDLTGLDRDPWGSPYILNENEGEDPANPCVHDTITSTGPDGIYNTDDDLQLSISFSNCF